MPLIEIAGLTKTYTSGTTETHALQGVALSVGAGEFVAIMGPSGSGKSTLLHMLGLLESPTSGTYRFNGIEVQGESGDALAQIRNRQVGFVFQAFNLMARATVEENVMLPLLYSDVPESEWRDRVAAAIARVGLSHRAQHRSSQLSGGEKQRVAIARALINNPSVIFADEPTGNLDSVSGTAILDLLSQLHRDEGRTIVLITHDSEAATRAQRIIRIRDGKIEQPSI